MVLLATDFDGTLAAIVDDPGAARADPEITGLLTELQPALAAVAVISGRDVSQLRALLPVPGLRLIGNHGMEWSDGERSWVAQEVEPFLSALRAARGRVVQLPAIATAGVRVEEKRASLSVHYRRAADPVTTGRALEAQLRPLAADLGLRLEAGRMVWELRPPVSLDKGTALGRLLADVRPQAMIYLGDDATDRDAFEAAQRFPGPHLAAGVRSAEVPQDVFASCDLLLDGIPAVRELLHALLSWTRS